MGEMDGTDDQDLLVLQESKDLLVIQENVVLQEFKDLQVLKEKKKNPPLVFIC